MTHEILEHTADVKFRASGDTLAEAFTSTVDAFAEITGADGLTSTSTLEFDVESEGLEALVFDFLDRMIWLQDVEDAAIVEAVTVDVREVEDGYSVRAVVEVAALDRASGLLDLKAPTYNDMVVERRDGWTVEAVMDV
ncbi:MAG: archease [Halobacteriota archaeon]